MENNFNHSHCNTYDGVKSVKLYYKCTLHRRCKNKVLIEMPHNKIEFNVMVSLCFIYLFKNSQIFFRRRSSPHSISQRYSRGLSARRMKEIVTNLQNSGTSTPSSMRLQIQKKNHSNEQVPSFEQLKTFLHKIRNSENKVVS